MSKLTRTQMIAHSHQVAITNHNILKNEVFKLHKFLIEHHDSDHTIDSEDVICDAIKLINKLNRKLKS